MLSHCVINTREHCCNCFSEVFKYFEIFKYVQFLPCKLCLYVDVEGIYLLTSGVPDQPADVCNSYLEEASAGRPIKLHITLFSIDEADVVMTNGSGDEPDMLPCRYASISQTAQALRDMAHSTAGGRFHWVRETGKTLNHGCSSDVMCDVDLCFTCVTSLIYSLHNK